MEKIECINHLFLTSIEQEFAVHSSAYSLFTAGTLQQMLEFANFTKHALDTKMYLLRINPLTNEQNPRTEY